MKIIYDPITNLDTQTYQQFYQGYPTRIELFIIIFYVLVLVLMLRAPTQVTIGIGLLHVPVVFYRQMFTQQ